MWTHVYLRGYAARVCSTVHAQIDLVENNGKINTTHISAPLHTILPTLSVNGP